MNQTCMAVGKRSRTVKPDTSFPLEALPKAVNRWPVQYALVRSVLTSCCTVAPTYRPAGCYTAPKCPPRSPVRDTPSHRLPPNAQVLVCLRV